MISLNKLHWRGSKKLNSPGNLHYTFSRNKLLRTFTFNLIYLGQSLHLILLSSVFKNSLGMIKKLHQSLGESVISNYSCTWLISTMGEVLVSHVILFLQLSLSCIINVRNTSINIISVRRSIKHSDNVCCYCCCPI